jgi:hypothetical protein
MMFIYGIEIYGWRNYIYQAPLPLGNSSHFRKNLLAFPFEPVGWYDRASGHC